jgi:hypothetical protein
MKELAKNDFSDIIFVDLKMLKWMALSLLSITRSFFEPFFLIPGFISQQAQ